MRQVDSVAGQSSLIIIVFKYVAVLFMGRVCLFIFRLHSYLQGMLLSGDRTMGSG